MKLATKVTNPMHRTGTSGYVRCCYCGYYYTKLGISRHWSHCKKRNKE